MSRNSSMRGIHYSNLAKNCNNENPPKVQESQEAKIKGSQQGTCTGKSCNWVNHPFRATCRHERLNLLKSKEESLSARIRAVIMFLQPMRALHIALGSGCEELAKDGPSPLTCAHICIRSLSSSL